MALVEGCASAGDAALREENGSTRIPLGGACGPDTLETREHVDCDVVGCCGR
jgi:hypothetical protein